MLTSKQKRMLTSILASAHSADVLEFVANYNVNDSKRANEERRDAPEVFAPIYAHRDAMLKLAHENRELFY